MQTIVLFFAMALIAYLNYALLKSYWCHEGIWGEDVHEQ